MIDQNPFLILEERINKIEYLLKSIDDKLSIVKPQSVEKLPISIGEASKITGFAKQTIYHMVSEGRIPFRRRGRRLFFMHSELIE